MQTETNEPSAFRINRLPVKSEDCVSPAGAETLKMCCWNRVEPNRAEQSIAEWDCLTEWNTTQL